MANYQIKSGVNPREGSIPSESLNTKSNSSHVFLVFGIHINYMSDYFLADEFGGRHA